MVFMPILASHPCEVLPKRLESMSCGPAFLLLNHVDFMIQILSHCTYESRSYDCKETEWFDREPSSTWREATHCRRYLVVTLGTHASLHPIVEDVAKAQFAESAWSGFARGRLATLSSRGGVEGLACP